MIHIFYFFCLVNGIENRKNAKHFEVGSRLFGEAQKSCDRSLAAEPNKKDGHVNVSSFLFDIL